ncbi:hypothetical protein GCM10025876_13380 [Demequina litorisediminis]|uniref:Uncharacterized protein n=1 Tax=Demequina litorisediminis TaxID=1849022 RepID=A0ABQ6IBR7_9MICO|nr:hypothetical protein GCM10025876_13380 [Demequina litorisediminis]
MGATRWEMIKMAVFPFGRSGMIGATMLGLGRALGETMAVLMIISPGLSLQRPDPAAQPAQHHRGLHRAAVPRGQRHGCEAR